jgi:hypothetical protein
MRVRNLSGLGASLVLGAAFVVLLAFPGAVHADTYHIYYVANLQFEGFYGLAADGTVVISYYDCPGYAFCYMSLVDGVITTYTYGDTPPSLIYDNGTPCTPTDLPPGTTLRDSEAVCNSGREVFEVTNDVNLPYPSPDGLYTGPDPGSDFVPHSSLGPMALNANGDIVFRAIDGDEVYEAVDLTTQTPEPGGMALVGAGVVMAAEWLRRRRARRTEA